jgi:anthranilate phosphoribosyltransferase
MITAFVLAITESGKEREVLNALEGMKEVKEKWNVYGDYDILIKLEVENLDKLNEFLIQKLRKVENLSMTTTMIGL